MVVYDDKKWLSRLIRTAFSIDDDTGICEKVLKQRPYLGPEYEDDSESISGDESFEIREGAELSHRRRSNTALRLEKLDKQRKAQTDVQFIKVNPDETGKNDLHFERDTTYRDKIKSRDQNTISFKQMIDSVPDPDKIPFVNYSRFDSSCHPSVPCKKIAIFLTFLDTARRAYPLRVGIVSAAKVDDLIGLTLWLASQKYPDVQLFLPSQYKLMIADEDGDWDDDFPPLDRAEPVSKFSFSHLAVVKLAINVQAEPAQKVKPTASFLLPNRTTFKLVLEDQEITMGQLINLLLNKSGWSKHILPPGSTNVGYHLEKHGDPSVKFLDPSMPFSQSKCKEFCLVRDGAKSVQVVKGEKSMGASKNSGDRNLGLRSDLYPVMVSGRFNKSRRALCVIWSGDRMDLEFQHKTKTYPLNLISGVKFDTLKNRIILSLSQVPSTSSATHYLTSSTQLTFTTAEHRTATELYQHLNSILAKK